MAKIERRFRIDSLVVDKKFLNELWNIIESVNPKDRLITEIIVYSEQETSTFHNIKDFIESRILPKKIKNISIRVKGNIKYVLKKDKLIEFFISFHEDLEKSYYTLEGYEDGKLSSCQKRI